VTVVHAYSALGRVWYRGVESSVLCSYRRSVVTLGKGYADRKMLSVKYWTRRTIAQPTGKAWKLAGCTTLDWLGSQSLGFPFSFFGKIIATRHTLDVAIPKQHFHSLTDQRA
jgi:hypothetical protein